MTLRAGTARARACAALPLRLARVTVCAVAVKRSLSLVPSLVLGLSLFAAAAPARAQSAGSAGDEEIYLTQLLMAGMRDRAALTACVRANREAFRTVAPRVRFVRGRVTAEGRLRDVAIEPALRVPPRARRCVLAVLSSWRVSPPASGREVPLRIDVEGIRRAAGLAGLVGAGG